MKKFFSIINLGLVLVVPTTFIISCSKRNSPIEKGIKKFVNKPLKKKKKKAEVKEAYLPKFINLISDAKGFINFQQSDAKKLVSLLLDHKEDFLNFVGGPLILKDKSKAEGIYKYLAKIGKPNLERIILAVIDKGLLGLSPEEGKVITKIIKVFKPDLKIEEFIDPIITLVQKGPKHLFTNNNKIFSRIINLLTIKDVKLQEIIDDPKLKKIINDPKIKNIINDSKLQKIINEDPKLKKIINDDVKLKEIINVLKLKEIINVLKIKEIINAVVLGDDNLKEILKNKEIVDPEKAFLPILEKVLKISAVKNEFDNFAQSVPTAWGARKAARKYLDSKSISIAAKILANSLKVTTSTSDELKKFQDLKSKVAQIKSTLDKILLENPDLEKEWSNKNTLPNYLAKEKQHLKTIEDFKKKKLKFIWSQDSKDLFKSLKLKADEIDYSLEVFKNNNVWYEWYETDVLLYHIMGVAAWRNYNSILKTKWTRKNWIKEIDQKYKYDDGPISDSKTNYNFIIGQLAGKANDFIKWIKDIKSAVQKDESLFKLQKTKPNVDKEYLRLKAGFAKYEELKRKKVELSIEEKKLNIAKQVYDFFEAKKKFEEANKITNAKLLENKFLYGYGLLELSKADLTNLLWGFASVAINIRSLVAASLNTLPWPISTFSSTIMGQIDPLLQGKKIQSILSQIPNTPIQNISSNLHKFINSGLTNLTVDEILQIFEFVFQLTNNSLFNLGKKEENKKNVNAIWNMLVHGLGTSKVSKDRKIKSFKWLGQLNYPESSKSQISKYKNYLMIFLFGP